MRRWQFSRFWLRCHMKLGFEESQSAYTSGSQSARAWTEAWVSSWAYCPHCGNAKISSFPNNSPLADFFCTSCNEEFELKSQKGKFGTRVVDGAFKTKCERLAASNNPNLFLMNYDLNRLRSSICSSCRSTSSSARSSRNESRWPRRHDAPAGSVQNLAQPRSGVRRDSYRPEQRHPREGTVLADWQRTLFLRSESPETRGWLLDVMKCVESLGKRDSRSTRSTPSSGISASSIPATRTSSRRYGSSCNICATADLSISFLVVIIVCGPRRIWHGLVSEFLPMRPLQEDMDR